MQPTLDTRKPVDSLDENDLKVFPVWEFATDEEDDEDEDRDETWVRPVDVQVIPQGEYSLLVAANFATSSGAQFPGLIVVSTDDGIEFNGGAILHKNDYIPVPSPDFWNADEDNEKIVTTLGMSKSDVFPLCFTLAVPIDGETSLCEGEFNA
jgi:hypothetical protein